MRACADTISVLVELLLNNKTQTCYTTGYVENFKNCSLLWLKAKIHRAAVGDETGDLGRNAVGDIERNSESILERLLKL